MHAEIDAVLGGAPPTLEDLPQLNYTEMVFAESMRLYPPAWAMGRQSTADVELGPYRFPAGSISSSANTSFSAARNIFPTLCASIPNAFSRSKRPSVRGLPIFPSAPEPAVYRRGVCLDGGGSDGGHHRTEMATAVCSRTDRRCAAQDHAASQVPDDVCSRVAVEEMHVRERRGAPQLPRLSRDMSRRPIRDVGEDLC